MLLWPLNLKCYENNINPFNDPCPYITFDSELYWTVHLWESVQKCTLRYVPRSVELTSVENETGSVELLCCQQERLIVHITLQSVHK